MIRHVRELEVGDTVRLFRKWRTIADVFVECPLVRVTFDTGESTLLPPFLSVRCAA